MRNLLTGLLLFTGIIAARTQTQYRFDHIGTDQGLIENRIEAIYQDSVGFMWFGTYLGICRYDGREFREYPLKPESNDSQNPQSAILIVGDAIGNMWVGTCYKLHLYDRLRNSFSEFDPGDSIVILSLFGDSRGNLWVGTMSDGLFRFDVTEKRFIPFNFEFSQDIPRVSVTQIGEDGFGNLWFSYPNGLHRYSWQDDSLTTFPFREDFKMGFNDGIIKSLFRDSQGSLWIGTSEGVYIVDSHTDKPYKSSIGLEIPARAIAESKDGTIWIAGFQGLYTLNNLAQNSESGIRMEVVAGLENQAIGTLYTDPGGDLWIGTWFDGLYHWSPHQKGFKKYQSILGKDVQEPGFMEKGNGEIWICSGRDLVSFDPVQEKFYQEPEFSDMDGVGKLAKHPDGWIWSASWLGLRKFHPVTKEVVYYLPDPDNPGSLPGVSVPAILIDRKGTVWVGVWDMGLYRYLPETGHFAEHPLIHPVHVKPFDHLFQYIKEDHAGNLWIGMLKKVIKLNPDHDLDTVYSFGSRGLHEDSVRTLWLPTFQEGLCRLDPATGQTQWWTSDQGLPSNSIRSVLEDGQGRLWLGTSNGLSRFDPKSQKFTNYTIADGLPGTVFSGDCLKTRTGEFYFGLSNGFIRFHPDHLGDNPLVPEIVLTDFKIGHQKVPVDGRQEASWEGDSPLKVDITQAREIELNWQQNNISFTFVALNFVSPEKNQYRYRLENYDDNWTETDQERPYANYTNLDPGHYIFRVIGSNNDEVWNDQGAALSITIVPPWWWNTWSKLFYLLAFLSGLWFMRRYERKREQLRYALEIEKVKGGKLEELSELKTQFFTNVSHELRTPLTLILAPVKELIERHKNKDLDLLKMIESNGHRLLQLVNQLLDLSKIDANHLPLKVSRLDLVTFIRQIFNVFASAAHSRDIQYTFTTDQEFLPVYFDQDKLEKILINLLSNAFKFTPEGEEIEVILEREAEYARISIVDHGIGITEDQLPKIFDRFYQADGAFEGSGVGLALTKELVELHHGTIKVSHSLTGGTCFTILLLLGKNHLKENEIIESSPINHTPTTLIGHLGVAHSSPNSPAFFEKELPLILIIEDNADMRTYLRHVLGSYYRVAEAIDGDQGLIYAKEHIPDLVISDVMMPGMTGLEVCDRLKSDLLTCHIPIILLTAKTDMNSRIEGIHVGADDYLAKPFDHLELLARTKALIELRKKLRERFQSALNSVPGSDNIIEEEDAFIRNLKQLIADHMTDPDFGVPQVCRKLGISRAQLYRKMKALTNDSVGNYIIHVRMQKARELLREKELNISEVAYEVGFRDPAYFSRTFRKTFGTSPSEMR
jgi:signal transduction histidine kinase/ligand-binding sensor domain-containing protein/DNA-binding response OmpR family regulator